MKFRIIPTKFFLEQIKGLDKKTRRIIYSKKELLKTNPFRYKKVNSKSYNHVFSIKLISGNKVIRLIYVVLKDIIFFCFILDRSKDYKDLERYFKKIELK